jgi:hypothetical protein
MQAAGNPCRPHRRREDNGLERRRLRRGGAAHPGAPCQLLLDRCLHARHVCLLPAPRRRRGRVLSLLISPHGSERRGVARGLRRNARGRFHLPLLALAPAAQDRLDCAVARREPAEAGRPWRHVGYAEQGGGRRSCCCGGRGSGAGASCLGAGTARTACGRAPLRCPAATPAAHKSPPRRPRPWARATPGVPRRRGWPWAWSLRRAIWSAGWVAPSKTIDLAAFTQSSSDFNQCVAAVTALKTQETGGLTRPGSRGGMETGGAGAQELQETVSVLFDVAGAQTWPL